MLNLRHRDSMEHPSAVPVGAAFDVTLVLDQMAYRLAAGHQIRLAISTTYWSFLWPSAKAATVTILDGDLDVPVHAGVAGDEWIPPEAEAATPWAHRVLRKPRAERRIETNLISGEVALVVVDDTGLVENTDHGLISGERMAERWSVHPGDPLSAECFVEFNQSLARGDWAVQTKGWARMTSTKTALILTAHLEAWDGDATVCSRDWHEVVPREQV